MNFNTSAGLVPGFQGQFHYTVPAMLDGRERQEFLDCARVIDERVEHWSARGIYHIRTIFPKNISRSALDALKSLCERACFKVDLKTTCHDNWKFDVTLA